MSGEPRSARARSGAGPSAKVLFYYGSNLRSVALETQILELHRRGVPIEVLTTCEAGALHERLSEAGIPVHTHVVRKGLASLYYARHLVYLVRTCRRGRFTAVFPNAQQASFIAMLAQFFIEARVVVFRHHFTFADEGEGRGLTVSRRERWMDVAINRLARRIVVPSGAVLRGMVEHEGVDPDKLEVLPYVYDFARYATPDRAAVASLRERHPARLRLLIASRMVPFKRHALAFEVMARLLGEGLDLVLFVLDDGPERGRLEEWVRTRGLEERIVLMGFRTDFVDVMAASDLLLHPSLTEASSSVVKEMGLLARPVLACAGVGDFDDYLVPGRNAFVVPRGTDGTEIEQAIREAYADPTHLAEMGRAHREAVLARFQTSDRSMKRYLELAELP